MSRGNQSVRVLLATLSIFVLGACGGGAAPAADSTEQVVALGVENIAIVKQGQLESGPTISGALTAERQATLRAEIAGPVVSTAVDRGDNVARGTVLARLDDAEIQVAYLSARSALTSTELDAAVAKREEDRAVTLAAAGAISERELEQAKRVNSAAQAQLADAKARMALAEKQLSATRITAPFSGTVSEKHVSGGDVVQPGNALFTIIDPGSMRLEASVAAQEMARVRPGAPVRFTVSGYAERSFTGRVARVSPSADPATGQINVTITIPNAGQSLVSGLFAEGRIATQTRTALLAPMSAVNVTGPVPVALRVKNGRVEKIDVTVGLRDPATETVEVLTGAVAGDTLLLGSAQGIPPGSPVTMATGGDPARRPPQQTSGGRL